MRGTTLKHLRIQNKLGWSQLNQYCQHEVCLIIPGSQNNKNSWDAVQLTNQEPAGSTALQYA